MLSAMTGHLVCFCGGFGMLWMVLACFGNSLIVQTKVVESLDQKAENLLMDLMDCLVA